VDQPGVVIEAGWGQGMSSRSAAARSASAWYAQPSRAMSGTLNPRASLHRRSDAANPLRPPSLRPRNAARCSGGQKESAAPVHASTRGLIEGTGARVASIPCNETTARTSVSARANAPSPSRSWQRRPNRRLSPSGYDDYGLLRNRRAPTHDERHSRSTVGNSDHSRRSRPTSTSRDGSLHIEPLARIEQSARDFNEGPTP